VPIPRRAALQGLRVAVVDDVMTTGATMSAVAQALRAAGARSVQAWVLTRTPSPRD
jgi:predicted amidophosphoribosyltransferase